MMLFLAILCKKLWVGKVVNIEILAITLRDALFEIDTKTVRFESDMNLLNYEFIGFIFRQQINKNQKTSRFTVTRVIYT